MAPLGNPSHVAEARRHHLTDGAVLRTFLHVWREVVEYKVATAPESATDAAVRVRVYMGLVLTTVSPARSTPKMAIGYCSTLGSIRRPDLPFQSSTLIM